MDNDAPLQGLLARLELDADLGIDYVSQKNDLSSILARLEFTRRTAPARSLSRSSMSREREEKIAPPKPISTTEKAEPKPEPAYVARPATPSRPAETPLPTTGTRRIGTKFSLVPLVEPPPSPEKEAELAELRAACMECRACDLCERRNSVVWGEGSLDASVLFIGEAPGKDEDAEGRPFVGRSGRLLTDIIEKGMKTPRSHVYIANMVKCRPPGNRDPRPDEVAACSRYLSRQIAVIQPRVIVAVGSVAGKSLLNRQESGGLRGVWHDYQGTPLRVIYHPSYLLRMRRTENDRTTADKTTWMDIQEVMARL